MYIMNNNIESFGDWQQATSSPNIDLRLTYIENELKEIKELLHKLLFPQPITMQPTSLLSEPNYLNPQTKYFYKKNYGF